jgi:hypothetical protein
MARAKTSIIHKSLHKSPNYIAMLCIECSSLKENCASNVHYCACHMLKRWMCLVSPLQKSRHLYLSGMWLGVDLHTDTTEKTCVQ